VRDLAASHPRRRSTGSAVTLLVACETRTQEITDDPTELLAATVHHPLPDTLSGCARR